MEREDKRGGRGWFVRKCKAMSQEYEEEEIKSNNNSNHNNNTYTISSSEQWKCSETEGIQLVVSTPPPQIQTHLQAQTFSEPQATPLDKTQEEAELFQEAKCKTEMEGGSDQGSSKKIDEDKKKQAAAVGFLELFRFADRLDYVLMIVGTVGAFVHGCSLPVFLRFFADLVNSFGSNADNIDKMTQEVLKVMILYRDYLNICNVMHTLIKALFFVCSMHFTFL